MAVHIEAQDNAELVQIRSRELQMENTEKLDNIIPIVKTIDSVDLNTMESNTNEIKDMIVNNIDNQANLDDIANELTKISKSMTELKKANTRLTNSLKEMKNTIDEYQKKFGDIDG